MQEYIQSFAGELLGTFILVFFGISAVAVTVLFSALSGLFQVAIVWGIGVLLAIYSTRHLSCAHLNPAVSLGMVLAGRMPFRKLPVYWLAQIVGAFLAGVVLYLLFASSIASFEQVHHLVRGNANSLRTAMIFADYFPNPGVPANIVLVTPFLAFLVETLGTLLLVTTIFMLTEGCNVGGPPSSIAPILIGLTVTVLITALAPLTMAGINPARDFGPRLFAYLAGWRRIAIPGPSGGFFIVYILGPLVGGAIAAILFTRALEPLMKGVRLTCTCQEIMSETEAASSERPNPWEEPYLAGGNGLKILVFGSTPPCATCTRAEQEAYQAAMRFPAGRVMVEKHDAQSAVARSYGVTMTPTVIVGDKKFVGKIVSGQELIKIIDDLLHL